MTAIPPPEAAAAHPVAWAAYASQGRWKPARHLKWLGDQLMRVARGDTLRLVVSLPPRHGKSELISRHFTAWWLGTHPSERVILISMQERLTRRWSRQARDDFKHYAEELWGVTSLSRASTAEWDVYRDSRQTGGSMSAVGSGGTIVGKGAHLLVIDDLIRSQAEANNDNLREATWEWFQSACLTRLQPPGRVVILSTRWHHDDLIGRLQAMQSRGELGEPWQFVNVPAICEDEGDPIGRKAGEALWPEMYPLEWLKLKEKDVGPFVWASQYQGRPTPVKGAIFKKEWFRYYDPGAIPGTIFIQERGTCQVSDLERFATVDLAASTKRRADYTAISVWGFHPQWHLLILLDHLRERLGGPAIVPTLKRLAAQHELPIVYAERVGALLEHRLGDVLKEAAREGVPISEIDPSRLGKKEARAIPATGPFAAGHVYFPRRATWLPDLETELLTFPDGKHDDQVDAVTEATAVFQERCRRVKRGPGQSDDEERKTWQIGR